MNAFAIKGPDGCIDIGSLEETFEDAWNEYLQGRQITTQKGMEAEGYTCVPVVVTEAAQAGDGEAVAYVSRNTAGQIYMQGADGNAFDMSKHVGDTFYLHPPASADEGMVMVSAEVIRFLNGEGALQGCHFGERPHEESGAYWWRRHLPKIEAAAKGRK